MTDFPPITEIVFSGDIMAMSGDELAALIASAMENDVIVIGPKTNPGDPE